MTWKQVIAAYLIITVLLGIVWECIPFKDYRDISDDPGSQNVVGETDQTLEDLEILGITMDPNYKKRVHHFEITSRPSFAGPEVVSRDPLQKGVVLRVARILECSNCFLDDRVEVEVEVPGNDRYGRAPVRLWSVPIILPTNSREQGIELSTVLFLAMDGPPALAEQ